VISFFARARTKPQPLNADERDDDSAAAETASVAEPDAPEPAEAAPEPQPVEIPYTGRLGFDVGSAIDCGGRDYQEDALVTDFHVGDDFGMLVLADGMGGHAAGNVASNIVVTTTFHYLKRLAAEFSGSEGTLPETIKGAVICANEAVGEHVRDNPDTKGMGSTVVAAVLVGAKIYWTSVGDSPLYLLRDGELSRINQDHSMAPQIDYMVKSGMMSEEQAANHPNRHCLTSALTGTAIARIDTPSEGFDLRNGDILVISSDGLQYLTDDEIKHLIEQNRRSDARRIASELMKSVLGLDDPSQDNVSLAVVKVEPAPVLRVTTGSGANRGDQSSVTRLVLEEQLD
jgi:PPM family protein phosphatase